MLSAMRLSSSPKVHLTLIFTIILLARPSTCPSSSLISKIRFAADVQRLLNDFPTLQFWVNSHYSADEARCRLQLNMTLHSLKTGHLWAIQMLDAWGKIPSGILDGNRFALGDFDECMRVHHRPTDSDDGCLTIRGEYCLVVMHPTAGPKPVPLNLSSSLNVGVCMPNACTPSMVEKVFNEAAEKMKIPVAIDMSSQMCSRAENRIMQLDQLDVYAIVAVALVVAAMILSTAYDLYKTFYQPASGKSLTLIAFSVYTNSRKLFHRPTPSTITNANRHDQLTCLYGIRVLSTVWVIFGHTYMLRAIGPLINATDLLKWAQQAHSMLLLSATVSVDTFFMLSGLLVTWSLLKQLDLNDGRLNLLSFYAHRYVRLTPSLAAAVLLSGSLMRRLGDGPLWGLYMDEASAPCRRWWWTALLYVQNYANPDDICMDHTWYLSADLQLYVLAPALLWPLWRVRFWSFRRRLAMVAVLPALVAVSSLTTFVVFLVKHFSVRRNPWGVLEDDMMGKERMRMTYYPTHCRMGAWLVGVMLGYLMHLYRGRGLNMPKRLIVLGWSTFVALVLAVIFGNYPLQSPAYDESLLGGAIYEATSRVAWASAVAWLVFACAHGYGGPINWLLSHDVWRPLARLSYVIYLVHLPVQLVLAGRTRVPNYFGDLNAIAAFWSAFGLTVTVAVVWTLAFEAPVLALERVLRRPSLAGQRRTLVFGADESTPLMQ